jgi:hypothetical protein
MEDATKIPLNLSPFLDFNVGQLKGWNKDFILAGDFIHTILANKKAHYIDFYIFTKEGFNELIDFFSNKYELTYTYKGYTFDTHVLTEYTCKEYYLEINCKNENPIRLYNAFNISPIQIMNAMELDILRCFYDGKNIYQFPDCDKAIDTQTIAPSYKHNHTSNNKYYVVAIMNAIHQGYKIPRSILKMLGIEFIDVKDNPDPVHPQDAMAEDYKNEYYNTPILVSDNQLQLLYDKYRDIQYEMQNGITVHMKHAAKLLLPIIYRCTIFQKNESIHHLFTYDFNEVLSMLNMQECEELDEKAEPIQEQKTTYRPPAPNRPLPSPPPPSPSQDVHPFPCQ